MKYIQSAMIIIIIVNAIRVLPKRYDEKNKPDYYLVYHSSAAGLFLGGFFPVGILSLALSWISTLCYNMTWMKEWTNEDIQHKGKTVLSAIIVEVMEIILLTVTFCMGG